MVTLTEETFNGKLRFLCSITTNQYLIKGKVSRHIRKKCCFNFKKENDNGK